MLHHPADSLIPRAYLWNTSREKPLPSKQTMLLPPHIPWTEAAMTAIVSRSQQTVLWTSLSGPPAIPPVGYSFHQASPAPSGERRIRDPHFLREFTSSGLTKVGTTFLRASLTPSSSSSEVASRRTESFLSSSSMDTGSSLST